MQLRLPLSSFFSLSMSGVGDLNPFEIRSATPSPVREVSLVGSSDGRAASADLGSTHRDGGNAPIDPDVFGSLKDLGILTPEQSLPVIGGRSPIDLPEPSVRRDLDHPGYFDYQAYRAGLEHRRPLRTVPGKPLNPTSILTTRNVVLS